MSLRLPISCIVPVYNRSSMVVDALDSIKRQSVQAQEVIVVDDGSNDETRAVVKSYVQEMAPEGWSLVCMTHCGFAGKVRNEGIVRAKAEWLAFLDSDDIWHEEKLKKQYAYALAKDYLVTHTREKWLRNNKEVSQKNQTHATEGDIFSDAVKKCIMGPSTLLLHTRVIQTCGMFNPALEIAEDYEFFLRICDAYDIGFVDKPLTVKRAGHTGQLSTKYSHIENFRLDALKPLVKDKAFTHSHLSIATKELERKTKIWSLGRDKRIPTTQDT